MRRPSWSASVPASRSWTCRSTRPASGRVLYVDGKLVIRGDSYLAEERLQSMLGVEVVQDGDWLLEDGRTALETIEEVEARRQERLGGEGERSLARWPRPRSSWRRRARSTAASASWALPDEQPCDGLLLHVG